MASVRLLGDESTFKDVVMLTPAKYWRVSRTLEAMRVAPARSFVLPHAIAAQSKPPVAGHGILLADYVESDETGLVRYLGVITSRGSNDVTVDWRAVEAAIWVDTDTGRRYWQQPGGFGFASSKVAGYGLHQLFADAFPHLEVREPLPGGQRVALADGSRRASTIASERLNPMTVVGEPTAAPRGGYVYVLKSAYGYKVGRTKSMPNRMRAFGVKLPFLYTIPLCVWFDDHLEAEASYHRLFHDKHVNGEWFALQDTDIDLIRSRTFG
jgi:hypothetical protein